MPRKQQGTCNEAGCGKPTVARGLCRKHYDQLRNSGGGLKRASSEEGAVPGGLVPLEAFGPIEDTTMREALEWVANHVAVDGVTPEMAPNPFCYVWLKRCQASGAVADKLFELAMRLLPSGREQEQENRFREGLHGPKELIADIRRFRERKAK